WINTLKIDPDNGHIHGLIPKESAANKGRRRDLSLGSFFYVGLFLIKGWGLLLKKVGALYFTLFLPLFFSPLDFWEFQTRFKVFKMMVIASNVVIVWYLAVRVHYTSRRPAS